MGTSRGLIRDAIAFSVDGQEPPAVEVRVNFGVFAGRNATQAEIDDLARLVRVEVESFSVIAEERHEFGGERETSVRQVVIEVRGYDSPGLRDRLTKLAETWATACIQSRDDLGELGSEL
jgi:hypothetical protein